MTDTKISRTDAEWRELLTPDEFHVGVKHGTERPFSSPLDNEKRDGGFYCKGCGTQLWHSDHKFDSGTGWPSFFKPATDTAVATKRDFKLVLPRTECHCATCGLHQGHVFKDGPAPTGQRWCINGIVLEFREDSES